ncbi:ATP-NAD kinase-like domain-containing protein [Phaeosphaeriaceae sp. PMI808]|nr:ATP-NAD kinase-like domain-containing protein [Phaeosphaeriaceae sp. PMI808]
MADPETKIDKSMNEPKTPKEFNINLTALDGSFQVIANLQEDENATHPPRLINITKQPLQKVTQAPVVQNRETHIILSTGSGHQKADSFFDNVLEKILATLGLDNFQKHITQSETTIQELTRDIFFPKANQGTPLLIILASGDGGIVDLVNSLLATPSSPSYIAPQLILLPLGTANALYHSINAPSQNTWGLSALRSTTSKPLPIFTSTFSPGARLLVDEARREETLPTNEAGTSVLHGAVVCSWGMHASLVADSDTSAYRKHGIDRFKMAAQEALYPADGTLPHAYRATVSVLKKGEWVALPSESHLYVLATLVGRLEAAFCISPESRALDGSMYLVYFGPMDGNDAMRIMGLAYQDGKHVEDEKVRYEAIDGLRIEFAEEDGRWRRVCVDGKIVRVEAGGWVEVRKESRRVVDVVVAEG